MIEYSQSEQVNMYHPETSAVVLAVLFSQNYKSTYPYVLHFLRKYQNQINPDNVKTEKLKLEAVWSRVANDDFPSGDEDIDGIYKVCKASHSNKLNLIHSLTRITEWFLYTESYLREIYSPRMLDHLADINALALDQTIYPYDLKTGISSNVYTDLDKQEPHVIKFANKLDDKLHPLAFTKVNADKIKRCLRSIAYWVTSCDNHDLPDYAVPWVEMMREIRNDIRVINKEMHDVLKNGFTVEQLTTSESKSYCDDMKVAKEILIAIDQNNRLKTNKISALLANMFHLYYGPDLTIPLTAGQIEVLFNESVDCLYATAGPGLGPAFKIRIVYCTSSEIQNFCNILALFLMSFHKSCYHHAYLDQTGYIKANAILFKDVQCTDCTGYSDYLNRNIYRLILEWMGVDDDLIKCIMAIFSMKVMVNGQKFDVPFGALQGVKLLVFIMNDANALIGIVQNMCRITKWDVRQNAGDDVYAASTSTTFTKADLDIDILVWLYFNCPTNISKSAWLARDGYWDFCKVFFSHNGLPVTGIPPKFYLKEITCIRDFSQYYVVMDRANIVPERSIEEAYKILKPMLYEFWKLGMILPNRISDLSLDEKIEVAESVNYNMGGLSSETNDAEHRIAHLVNYCNELYTSYEMKVGDIYLFAMDAGFEGTIRDFLMQVRTTQAMDFLHLLTDLNLAIEHYQEGIISENEIRDIERRLESKTRVVLDSGRLSKSGSTYHRITPTENGDITLIKYDLDLSQQIPYQLPQSVFDVISYSSIMSDATYDDINRLNLYIKATQMYQYYKAQGRISCEGGGNYGNGVSYYYLYNEDFTRRYRLEAVNNDTTNTAAGIYSARSYASGEEYEFIEMCRKYGIMSCFDSIKRVMKETSVDLIKKIIRKIRVKDPLSSEQEIRDQVKENVDDFIGKYIDQMRG